MKYFKKKNKIAFKPILLLLIALLMFGFLFKDMVFRSLITVNLGGFYVGLLNKKAELINATNNNDIDVFEVSMSPNNFVKLQKERTIMSSNYILTGDQWNSTNNYFKSKVRVGDMNSKAEIKLFGMNPDHYRRSRLIKVNFLIGVMELCSTRNSPNFQFTNCRSEVRQQIKNHIKFWNSKKNKKC